MSSKRRPAAAKPSSQGCFGKSIGGGWPLSSPVHVSMSTVYLGVRTIGLIGDDHSARCRIEDFGVKLCDMVLADNRVIGGEHLPRRPPRPITLDDAGDADVA